MFFSTQKTFCLLLAFSSNIVVMQSEFLCQLIIDYLYCDFSWFSISSSKCLAKSLTVNFHETSRWWVWKQFKSSWESSFWNMLLEFSIIRPHQNSNINPNNINTGNIVKLETLIFEKKLHFELPTDFPSLFCKPTINWGSKPDYMIRI